MKTIALLSAAALIGVGSLASSGAEARGGGAIAAGIIGGLAVGALVGAASQARTEPAYGYGYAGPAYRYAPAPVIVHPAPAYRAYDDDAPGYGPPRVVTYDRGPVGYGPGRDPYCARRGGWDRGYGDRGW